jgi:hypothetical protein
MGYHTDFMGHFEVHPPLNEAEYSYLTAFAESRRHRGRGGPYVVPDNPMASYDDDRAGVDIDDYNTPPDGQPELWCPWVPSCSGECVSICGGVENKHYRPNEWLQYLVDHFLRPGAAASRDKTGMFDGFTFDHKLEGVVAACLQETGRLWLIRPVGDEITEELLWPGKGQF